MNNIVVAIVDDHDRVRDSIANLLQAVDFGVEAFSSAEDFLNYCENHEWRSLCCVVLDVRLPGMNGIEMLCELKRRAIGLPVVLISGHATREVAELGQKHGAATLLEKPFDGELLVEEVKKAIMSSDFTLLKKAR